VARKKAAGDGTERLRELLKVLENEPPGDLRPGLQGYAYRFTLYFPLLSQGKPVFTEEQFKLLTILFLTRFEGFTATTVESSPPWFGSWLPPGAEKPVIDRHTLFVVYTPQVDEAKLFFRYLKSILQLEEVAGQEVVLVEHTTVWLMEGGLLPPGPPD
jgi:hypothetical protein